VELASVISDSGHRVGVRVRGGSNYPQSILLSGNQSNTFSGDLEVLEKNVLVVLAKTGGAIAVKGNIFINSGASLRFDGDNQIGRGSVIKLRNGGLLFSENKKSSTNVFGKIVVEESGSIDFGKNSNAYHSIYIDDLSVTFYSSLTINGWKEGYSRLLVRKGGLNIQSALKRIKFEGYDPSRIQLVDFNRDYWEVSALPEPTTYGAILGVVSLGIFACRRKKRLCFLGALTMAICLLRGRKQSNAVEEAE